MIANSAATDGCVVFGCEFRSEFDFIEHHSMVANFAATGGCVVFGCEFRSEFDFIEHPPLMSMIANGILQPQAAVLCFGANLVPSDTHP